MNRLSLSQRLISECGISGTMTSTLSQTGEFARVVNWIDTAWQDLQTDHDDWSWMRSSNVLGAGCSFTTVAGQASYPLGSGAGTCGVPVASFAKWDRDSFRDYTTSVGTSDENFLDEWPFDDWRDVYMLGANRSVRTRPVVVAFGPDESVCLGPPPNALYTITGDYWTAPLAMAADTDTPTGLPVAQHMAIVYKAMQYYASYESAPEVMGRGTAGYKLLLSQLEALKLPQMIGAGALA